MNILIACEYTGALRDLFNDLGHICYSCDLPDVPPEGRWLDMHLYDDVLSVLDPQSPACPVDHWDMMIAHPECTFLTNAAVWCLYEKDGVTHNYERWLNLHSAAAFFLQLEQAHHIPRRCIENPIMHGHALSLIGRKQDQIIQPWMFGYEETKATCLWLHNLPPLIPTHEKPAKVYPITLRQGKSDHRARDRSRTNPGVADAIVSQWGDEALLPPLFSESIHTL